ncbi:MAG: SPASM domain-containing protein [Porticoccus sp.]|nr:SPASM domain-containing protein [Porticoccus sp.]
MRLSKYLQTKKINPNVIGIYSPFGQQVSYLSTNNWQLVVDGDFESVEPEIIDDLEKRCFLVEDGFEEKILKEYLPPSEHIREMWLVVEQACNMACQYCVTEGNVEDPDRRIIAHHKPEPVSACGNARQQNQDTMNFEVALAAVRKFEGYLQDSRPHSPRVTLYGGEPLLNWPLIRQIVPYIRRISYPGQICEKPVQVLIITNGQIFRHEILDFFVEHHVAVSVSLDGLQKHHDDQRITATGKGTFKRAASSLSKFKAAGLNVGICTTIGTHNVTDLPEIVEYFADEFCCPVELQVPFDIPYNGGNQSSVRMIDAAPYATEAYERLRSRGLLEGLVGRRMMQVSAGNFHHRDCSAVGGQLVIAPDGSMGPCHAFTGERKYFSGNVINDHPWENPAFHEWSRRQPVNMPGCHGCSAISICGGGCPYNAHISSGSIWDKDPQQCEYMHYLIDWMIDDAWKNRH